MGLNTKYLKLSCHKKNIKTVQGPNKKISLQKEELFSSILSSLQKNPWAHCMGLGPTCFLHAKAPRPTQRENK